MPNYLNVGCGMHYAEGWTNTDVWEDDATKPDVIVEHDQPYPFEDDTFDAVYLGHVLEHIAWREVLPFLHDMNRIAKPNAPILGVGPDLYRTIERWAANQEPRWMIEAVAENQDVSGGYTAFVYGTESDPASSFTGWDGAAHYWNCHEKRMLSIMAEVFDKCTAYTDKIETNTEMTSWKDNENNITWPVVGYWHWQCAVMGYAK